MTEAAPARERLLCRRALSSLFTASAIAEGDNRLPSAALMLLLLFLFCLPSRTALLVVLSVSLAPAPKERLPASSLSGRGGKRVPAVEKG